MDAPNFEECKEITAYFLNQNAALHARKRAAFLHLYTDLTCVKMVNGVVFPVEMPNFGCHRDVLALSDLLKKNSSLTRKACLANVFQNAQVSSNMRQSAFWILIQLNFMINCDPLDYHLPGTRMENWTPKQWQDNESFNKFVRRAIPRASQPLIFLDDKKRAVKAWKLASRYDIKLVATDDIAEHLLFDSHGGRLKIFHHTSWLSAQLDRRVHSSNNDDDNLNELLTSGCLPRQLIVETIETLYGILFPLINESSGRSRKLLKDLVRTSGFDPDIIADASRGLEPDVFEYHYWGERLTLVHEHIQKPLAPSTRLMSWLERNATDRLALWLAILGLFLSGIFGLLSCAIGVAQLWVSILAWKNPMMG